MGCTGGSCGKGCAWDAQTVITFRGCTHTPHTVSPMELGSGGGGGACGTDRTGGGG
jgi:hypothetical protein